MIPRFSMLPGKQAIYILLARDSRLSEGNTIGVDFGCGAMLNRRIFRTAEYWGVDVDKPTLEKGMRRHPEARGVLSKIEDADIPPADFVICINVFFGTNFEKAADEGVVLDSIIRNISRRNAAGDVRSQTRMARHDREIDGRVFSSDADRSRPPQ